MNRQLGNLSLFRAMSCNLYNFNSNKYKYFYFCLHRLAIPYPSFNVWQIYSSILSALGCLSLRLRCSLYQSNSDQMFPLCLFCQGGFSFCRHLSNLWQNSPQEENVSLLKACQNMLKIPTAGALFLAQTLLRGAHRLQNPSPNLPIVFTLYSPSICTNVLEIRVFSSIYCALSLILFW